MEVPEARGMGRSGPRRRTGCITCRARKVRCPEEKPVCANCTRLRLRCVYKSIPDTAASLSSRGRTPSHRPDLHFFNTVLRSDGSDPTTGPYGSDFSGPFDMLGFIGEITSELQQKHLDLTNGISDFTGPISRPESNGPTLTPDAPSHVDGEQQQHAGAWSEAKPIYEDQLLSHFMTVESPPAIFGPLHTEWKCAKPAIVAMAEGFAPLLNAVYCFADVHKAMAHGSRWNCAPSYHRLASSEVQSCIVVDVTDSTLRQVFATVFLLMLSELLSGPELCRPGTSYLHSAYLLLQRFHGRTKSWTGFGNLLISWISILDLKALIAGRDGDPLVELGDVSEPLATHRTSDKTAEESSSSFFSSPSFLVYDAIVGPVSRFSVQAQQVLRRIVCIDLHHRSRGTLSDEFEVMQLAHKIGADLETLWTARPPVIDVYDRPEALVGTLTRALALDICRSFRLSVANFLTSFIYLHRVAFAIYPRTDRVNRAVDKIIHLATLESESETETESQAARRHLPPGFLWPLFIAGLEGSLEQRQWIVQEMQRMATGEDARHPSADKVLVLLGEMTRRQDASRTWADSKCVRRELFADFFVMI